MIRELIRHVEYPGAQCFCRACLEKRAADLHAEVEAAATVKAIRAERQEIADRTPEFWNWKPVD